MGRRHGGGHHLRIGSKINFATWNCGGLSYTQRELCSELGYDILGLTETHDKATLQNNHKFITGEPAPNEDSFAGVALLLSDRVAKCVLYNGNNGSRIVYAKIKARPFDLFVIVVYVPHSSRKKKPFFIDVVDQLEEVLIQVSPRDCVVILGDFNCKLGRSTDNLTGRWCIHKRSNNEGKILLELMRRRRLTAISTFFQPKKGKTNATYLARDPQYSPSQIDYVLVSSRWATSVYDSKVKWGITCKRWGRHYDHGLVSCLMASRLKASSNRKRNPDYSILHKDQTLSTKFEEEVKNNLAHLQYNSEDLTDSLAHLQKSVSDAASKILPPVKRPAIHRRHVSIHTKELYEKRRKDFQTMEPKERKLPNKAIMKSSREDYRMYIDSILKDMEVAEVAGNTRELTRLIKILGGKTKSSMIGPSKDLNGKSIISTKQLLDAWNQFLSKKFAEPAADNNRPRENTVCAEDHLTDKELEESLKSLKRGRAPGWDGIPIEAYKKSQSARKELFRIVHLLWDREIIPPDLVRGIFIMFYKKKDRNEYSNYRAICLLCHAYKLLSAVIARRLHGDLENILPDSQAGFRAARGTRDNVCILKWTISMILRESREAVVTFIDYTAAFDTQSQIFLDEALSKAEVSQKVRRIVQSIFRAASGCVRINNSNGICEYSDTFNIARGVLQGDIFSSDAFITGLWRIFETHDTSNAGVKVGDPPYEVDISGLEYADDAALLDENTEQSSQRVCAISQGSQKDAAMTISIPKTKALHIHKKVRVTATTESEISALKLKHKCTSCGRDFPTSRGLSIHRARWCDGGLTLRSRKGSLADKMVKHAKRKEKENERDHVWLDGNEIDNVYNFEYLGSRVQSDGDDEADIRHRMAIAQSVFGSLSHMWLDHRLPRSMKIRLYRLAVCSTFTHACEAWNLTINVCKRINGFNSRCLHIITGAHYRDTATNPILDLVLLVRKRRLRFLGHILRMDERRLLRRIFAAYVHGGSRAPEGSLMQDCKGTIEELTVLARDRKQWQRKVNALC